MCKDINNKLFEKLDSLEDSYLDVPETLCNIESPTSDKKRVDDAVAYDEYITLDSLKESAKMIAVIVHDI